MHALLTKVLRDLLHRPLRALLTVLGVAVGVGGVVAIVSTARNVVRAQRALFASTSQADIVYWVWDAPAGLVRTLGADPRIAAAELRLTYTMRWRTGERWMDITLVGISDFAQVRVNQFDLVAGSFPVLGDVLLEASSGRSAGAGPGDTITYRDALAHDRYLRVSGLARSPNTLSSALTKLDLGYVPDSYLQRLLGIAGYNQLLIKVHDPRETQAIAEHVSRLMRRQDLQAGSPELRNPDQFPGKRELDALIVVMFIFSALGLVLGGFLIVNTLAANVAAQIGEIGVLKALGASRARILALFLLEALVYGVLGSAWGILLGAVGGWRLLVWIGSLGNAAIPFSLAPEGVLLGVALGIGVALVSGLLPALQGTRVAVREALGAYGISSDYGTGWVERQLGRLRRLPPLAAMAMRNVSRRKGRSVLTLVVVALASAAFLSAAATRASVDTAIDEIFATYNVDAWVWLSEPVNTQVAALLTTVEGVQAAEGWLIADGTVGLSEARLWGLPARSDLYRHVLRAGRWFGDDEPEAMVLSAELADRRGLRVGDRVEVQAHGRTRRMDVVGIAVDNTIFLGGQLAGKAFLPRATLGSLLRQEDVASLYALALTSREPRATDRILAEVERKFRRWRPVVQPTYAEIASAREASRLLTLALVVMVVVVALVGALGVLNTFTLNVLERRREIGVLRVLGATDHAVLLAFWVEGLVLGGLGWVLGLALGYPAARLFTAQLGRVLFVLRFVLTPGAVLASAAFALGLALVASLGPAWGAARLRTAITLRYE